MTFKECFISVRLNAIGVIPHVLSHCANTVTLADIEPMRLRNGVKLSHMRPEECGSAIDTEQSGHRKCRVKPVALFVYSMRRDAAPICDARIVSGVAPMQSDNRYAVLLANRPDHTKQVFVNTRH